LKSPRTTTEGLKEVNHVEVLGVSSEQGKRHRLLTQETLEVPRITTYDVVEDDPLEVLQVNVVETWITPYQRYLADGLLPAEPTEAKAIKRNAGKYTLVDGKLFRHGYTHSILTCISGDQCTRIMAEFQEGICGSHVGGRALSLKVVQAGYYWSTMKEDCMRHAQRCEQCQKHVDWHHAPPKELRSIYSL